MTAKIAFLPLASGWPDLVGHHRSLLDDEVRTGAFVRAIGKVVKPGDVVADLGAGTGVLSIAASRAGAARVYAIERGPIAEVGAALTKENGASRVTWIAKHSREVVLPEDVDVIVSECFGVLAAGGTMLQAVADLRRRHLKRGGTVVPLSVAIFVALVEVPAAFRWVAQWTKRRHGMTFAAAAELAFNNVYNASFSKADLVTAPLRIADVDFRRGTFDGSALGKLRRTATVHGLAAWFEADLAPGVTLSTAPGKASTVWRQVFVPFANPVRVRRGANVAVTLRMAPAAVEGRVAYLDWAAEIDGAHRAGSTRRSYPETLPSIIRTPRFERKPLPASS